MESGASGGAFSTRLIRCDPNRSPSGFAARSCSTRTPRAGTDPRQVLLLPGPQDRQSACACRLTPDARTRAHHSVRRSASRPRHCTKHRCQVRFVHRRAHLDRHRPDHHANQSAGDTCLHGPSDLHQFRLRTILSELLSPLTKHPVTDLAPTAELLDRQFAALVLVDQRLPFQCPTGWCTNDFLRAEVYVAGLLPRRLGSPDACDTPITPARTHRQWLPARVLEPIEGGLPGNGAPRRRRDPEHRAGAPHGRRLGRQPLRLHVRPWRAPRRPRMFPEDVHVRGGRRYPSPGQAAGRSAIGSGGRDRQSARREGHDSGLSRTRRRRHLGSAIAACRCRGTPGFMARRQGTSDRVQRQSRHLLSPARAREQPTKADRYRGRPR